MEDTPMLHANPNGGSYTTQVIDSQHSDYIYKVTFDVYGRRMATCSGDRFVRIWDLTDEGSWTLAASWQAHRSTVTCISWAHPEFGSLLATSGSDHDCKIWEETKSNVWIVKAALTEARKSVTCVAFAPRHWGLKLAVGSADGNIRIYEAVDVMNVSQWPLSATLQTFDEAVGCTSVSWSTGRFEPPTLVVAGSHCVIYRYLESSRSWQAISRTPQPSNGIVLDVAWAPNVGRRFHYIASVEHDCLRIYKMNRKEDNDLVIESSQAIKTNVWRCEWNITGTVLAASGDAGAIEIFKPNGIGEFEIIGNVNRGDAESVPFVSTD